MNLVLYVLVYDYINTEITKFMTALSENVMGVVGAAALILVTIWVMIQGYRIVTGQSREPMMGLVVNSLRVVLIVSTATTLGVLGTDLHTLFTDTLQKDLNQVFTNDNTDFKTQIDRNLAYTAVAMAAIDGIQTAPGDPENVAAKARASDYAIFGIASPPMAAGAMMLMFNIAIALFIGLGPLFIICLLFNATKALFQKWLMYGIGTLFAMAMLSFISGIVLKVTISVAEGLWGASALNGLLGTNSVGITTQSMEQGGIGLLLTMLIISAPPMAAQFFNGTLGSFMAYSAFNGAGSRPGPQGQPPGSYGHGGQGASQASSGQTTSAGQHGSGAGRYADSNSGIRGANMTSPVMDNVKSAPATPSNPYLPPSSQA